MRARSGSGMEEISKHLLFMSVLTISVVKFELFRGRDDFLHCCLLLLLLLLLLVLLTSCIVMR